MRTDGFLSHAHGLELVRQVSDGVRRHVSLRVGGGAELRLVRVKGGLLLLFIR
jgi:hypothetical protein